MTLTHPRALLLALLLVAAPLAAQPVPGDFDPRTGDAWVDTWLDDVNRYGGAYRDPFVDELVRFHKAPRDLVLDLLRRPGWTPGDIYFACALAAQVGRPCRYVAEEYERDRGAGWGALAQRLGIAPGSPAFHRLKRGFVPTYDRWARPIQLDDDLREAFPGRGRPAGSRPDPAAARGVDADPVQGRSDRPGARAATRPDPAEAKANSRPVGQAQPAAAERSARQDVRGKPRDERGSGKRGRPHKDDRDED